MVKSTKSTQVATLPEDFAAKDKQFMSNCGREEALSVVRTLYGLQNLRIRTSNRKSAQQRGATNADLHNLPIKRNTANTPPILMQMTDYFSEGEKQMEKSLRAYVRNEPLGKWLLTIDGIDTKIAAVLLTAIDFNCCDCPNFKHIAEKDGRHAIPPHNCPGLTNASRILSFAGLIDPKMIKWGDGKKRPYNEFLKTTFWKLAGGWIKLSVSDEKFGMSDLEYLNWFKQAKIQEHIDEELPPLTTEELNRKAEKALQRHLLRKETQGSESSLYVRLYLQYKQEEIRKNENGELAQAAHDRLKMLTERRIKISDSQRRTLMSGKLQACGLDYRARRRVCKIFIMHYFSVGRAIYKGVTDVAPYCFTHMQGHTRYIAPPNWPMPGYEHLALKLPASIAVPQAATPNDHASNGRSSNGHANKRTRR